MEKLVALFKNVKFRKRISLAIIILILVGIKLKVILPYVSIFTYLFWLLWDIADLYDNRKKGITFRAFLEVIGLVMWIYEITKNILSILR